MSVSLTKSKNSTSEHGKQYFFDEKVQRFQKKPALPAAASLSCYRRLLTGERPRNENTPGTKTPPPSPPPCRRSAPHTDDGRRRKRRITNDPERRSQLYPLPPACSAIRVCSLQVLCAVLLVELAVFRPECRVFEP